MYVACIRDSTCIYTVHVLHRTRDIHAPRGTFRAISNVCTVSRSNSRLHEKRSRAAAADRLRRLSARLVSVAFARRCSPEIPSAMAIFVRPETCPSDSPLPRAPIDIRCPLLARRRPDTLVDQLDHHDSEPAVCNDARAPLSSRSLPASACPGALRPRRPDRAGHREHGRLCDVPFDPPDVQEHRAARRRRLRADHHHRLQ